MTGGYIFLSKKGEIYIVKKDIIPLPCKMQKDYVFSLVFNVVLV